MVGGTLPHNMIFAPYGSELEIILKTSLPNHFQAIVDKIKELRTTKIHAYIELFGVIAGRGPFLFLPRNITMDKKQLNNTKKDIAKYLMEYKRALATNRLLQKPSQMQLNESFLSFKDKIRQVNGKLFVALGREFESFERFVNLYFAHLKLALFVFRLQKLPKQIIRDCKNTFIKAFK